MTGIEKKKKKKERNKEEKISNEEIRPNDPWASNLLSIFPRHEQLRTQETYEVDFRK